MNMLSPQRVSITDRWIGRPADETFPDLNALFHHTRELADNSEAAVHDVRKIRVMADASLSRPESMTAMGLELPNGQITTATHWSFGQLCSLIGCPAGHYRTLPAPIGMYGLQYKLNDYRGELVKAYTDVRDGTLRALTSPGYGRVEDFKLVDAIRQIAGNGVGDTAWQAAHNLNKRHAPAFYASDRDMFCFLIDVQRPLQLRNPENGRMETLYRGFFAWNSEVGSRSLGIKTFLLRQYCDNRMILGSDQVEEVVIRHTKGAPERFLEAAAPALQAYANDSAMGIERALERSMTLMLAKNDEDAVSILNGKTTLSRAAARAAVKQHTLEEGQPPRSAWDMAQAITAYARSIPHQDDRIDLEKQATKLLTA